MAGVWTAVAILSRKTDHREDAFYERETVEDHQ